MLTLEIDDDDDEKDTSIGSVFMPLKGCSNAKRENPGVSGGSPSPLSRGDSGNFGNGKSKFVDNGGEMGFSAGLRPCNKRKEREEDGGGDGSGSSAFGGVERSNMAVLAKPLGIVLDSPSFHLFQLFMVTLNVDYMQCYC